MVRKARCVAFAALWLIGCAGTVAEEAPDDSPSQDGDGWSDASDDSSWNDGSDTSSSDEGNDGSDAWSDDGTGDASDGSDAWSDDGTGDDTGGDDTSGDDTGGDGTDDVPDDSLHWQQANLTNFESYPEEGSDECVEFSGCEYFGRFAGYDGVMSYEEVASRNIAAVRSDHFDQYVGHILRLRDEGRTIDVEVLDLCSDSDCNGCCSQNSWETGFLIDLEIHTAERFGTYHGVVEWACLDC